MFDSLNYVMCFNVIFESFIISSALTNLYFKFEFIVRHSNSFMKVLCFIVLKIFKISLYMLNNTLVIVFLFCFVYSNFKYL